MADYPVNPNPNKFDVYSSGFKTRESIAENGTSQRNIGQGSEKREYSLKYEVEWNDLLILKQFFESKKGRNTSFTFNPSDFDLNLEDEDINVRFNSDKFEVSRIVHNTLYSIELNLIELLGEISETPTPTLTISGPTPLTALGDYSYTVSGGVSPYTWSIDPNVNISIGSSSGIVTVGFCEDRNYTIHCSDSSGLSGSKIINVDFGNNFKDYWTESIYSQDYITLSFHDLVSTMTVQKTTPDAYACFGGSHSNMSGKRMVEITVFGNGDFSLGVALSPISYNYILGNDSWGYGYKSNGQKINNNNSTSYGSTYTNGDVIGICIDMTTNNRVLTFYKNGVSQGIAYNNISYAHSIYIVASLNTLNNYLYCNFGAFDFQYPVAGYDAWDLNWDITTDSETDSIGTCITGGFNSAYDNNLMDDNVTGSWYSYWGGDYRNTGWTGQDLLTSKVIDEYRIFINPAMGTYAPKNWTFEGSNTADFASPTILHTVTDWVAPSSVSTWTHFTFNNTTAFRYYRLNVTANQGSPSYLILAELEFCEVD